MKPSSTTLISGLKGGTTVQKIAELKQFHEYIEQSDSSEQITFVSRVMGELLEVMLDLLQRAESGEELRSLCVKCIGYLAHHPLHSKNFTSMQIKKTIETVTLMASTDENKNLCFLCMWFFFAQSFSETQLKPFLSRILESIRRCLTESTGKLQQEGLMALKTLDMKCHVLLLKLGDLWLLNVCELIVGTSPKGCDEACELLSGFIKRGIKDMDAALYDKIQHQIDTTIHAKMMEFATSPDGERARCSARGFAVFSRFLSEKSNSKLAMMNKLLSIMQKTLLHSDAKVRLVSMQSWESFVEVSHLCGSWKKRIKLLMTPVTRCFQKESNIEVRTMCLKAWNKIILVSNGEFESCYEEMILPVIGHILTDTDMNIRNIGHEVLCGLLCIDTNSNLLQVRDRKFPSSDDHVIIPNGIAMSCTCLEKIGPVVGPVLLKALVDVKELNCIKDLSCHSLKFLFNRISHFVSSKKMECDNMISLLHTFMQSLVNSDDLCAVWSVFASGFSPILLSCKYSRTLVLFQSGNNNNEELPFQLRPLDELINIYGLLAISFFSKLSQIPIEPRKIPGKMKQITQTLEQGLQAQDTKKLVATLLRALRAVCREGADKGDACILWSLWDKLVGIAGTFADYGRGAAASTSEELREQNPALYVGLTLPFELLSMDALSSVLINNKLSGFNLVGIWEAAFTTLVSRCEVSCAVGAICKSWKIETSKLQHPGEFQLKIVVSLLMKMVMGIKNKLKKSNFINNYLLDVTNWCMEQLVDMRKPTLICLSEIIKEQINFAGDYLTLTSLIKRLSGGFELWLQNHSNNQQLVQDTWTFLLNSITQRPGIAYGNELLQSMTRCLEIALDSKKKTLMNPTVSFWQGGFGKNNNNNCELRLSSNMKIILGKLQRKVGTLFDGIMDENTISGSVIDTTLDLDLVEPLLVANLPHIPALRTSNEDGDGVTVHDVPTPTKTGGQSIASSSASSYGSKDNNNNNNTKNAGTNTVAAKKKLEFFGGDEESRDSFVFIPIQKQRVVLTQHQKEMRMEQEERGIGVVVEQVIEDDNTQAMVDQAFFRADSLDSSMKEQNNASLDGTLLVTDNINNTCTAPTMEEETLKETSVSLGAGDKSFDSAKTSATFNSEEEKIKEMQANGDVLMEDNNDEDKNKKSLENSGDSSSSSVGMDIAKMARKKHNVRRLANCDNDESGKKNFVVLNVRSQKMVEAANLKMMKMKEGKKEREEKSIKRIVSDARVREGKSGIEERNLYIEEEKKRLEEEKMRLEEEEKKLLEEEEERRKKEKEEEEERLKKEKEEEEERLKKEKEEEEERLRQVELERMRKEDEEKARLEAHRLKMEVEKKRKKMEEDEEQRKQQQQMEKEVANTKTVDDNLQSEEKKRQRTEKEDDSGSGESSESSSDDDDVVPGTPESGTLDTTLVLDSIAAEVSSQKEKEVTIICDNSNNTNNNNNNNNNNIPVPRGILKLHRTRIHALHPDHADLCKLTDDNNNNISSQQQKRRVQFQGLLSDNVTPRTKKPRKSPSIDNNSNNNNANTNTQQQARPPSPVYPALINCTASIDKVRGFFPMSFRHMFAAQGVTTIGDLARMDKAAVAKLPLLGGDSIGTVTGALSEFQKTSPSMSCNVEPVNVPTAAAAATTTTTASMPSSSSSSGIEVVKQLAVLAEKGLPSEMTDTEATEMQRHLAQVLMHLTQRKAQ